MQKRNETFARDVLRVVSTSCSHFPNCFTFQLNSSFRFPFLLRNLMDFNKKYILSPSVTVVKFLSSQSPLQTVDFVILCFPFYKLDTLSINQCSVNKVLIQQLLTVFILSLFLIFLIVTVIFSILRCYLIPSSSNSLVCILLFQNTLSTRPLLVISWRLTNRHVLCIVLLDFKLLLGLLLHFPARFRKLPTSNRCSASDSVRFGLSCIFFYIFVLFLHFSSSWSFLPPCSLLPIITSSLHLYE